LDQSSAPAKGIQPIRNFARFFRRYNVGLSLLVAAIPILIGVWNLVPLYTNTKNFLTLVTSVGSYLLVGFIFSKRVAIGRLYFPGGGRARTAYTRDVLKSRWFSSLPLIFTVLSISFFYLYFALVNFSIEIVAYHEVFSSKSDSRNVSVCDAQSLLPGQRAVVMAEFLAFGKKSDIKVYCYQSSFGIEYDIIFPDQGVVQSILDQTPAPSVPLSFATSLFFMGAFLLATSAFILMGLKEYIQEELGLKDEDMISSPLRTTLRRRFPLEGVPGLYGIAEFSPEDSTLTPRIEGPFCTWHDLQPKPKDFDDQGKAQRWIHIVKRGDRNVEEECNLRVELSEVELSALLEDGAGRVITAQSRSPDKTGA
jgi:hypothetical protein